MKTKNINADWKTAESAWEFAKTRSKYHFKTDIIDPRWDTVQGLGRFSGDWTKELAEVEAHAQEVSVHNRRNQWADRDPEHDKVKLNKAETNDIEAIGGDTERTIFRVEKDLPPIFQKMVNEIGLDRHESRIHVQFPTECFIGHVDRFDLNWPDVDQKDMIRIGIMLKDWSQGHFFQFGNYPYQQWRAGDIHTFEYKHVPHYTANCGLTPRVTLFTTGIITDKTREFIHNSKQSEHIEI